MTRPQLRRNTSSSRRTPLAHVLAFRVCAVYVLSPLFALHALAQESLVREFMSDSSESRLVLVRAEADRAVSQESALNYSYRFSRKEATVWDIAFNCPLYMATVRDDGFVAAIGYDGGELGKAIRSDPEDASGLYVIAVDPHGNIIINERLPRGYPDVSQNPAGPARPYARAIAIRDSDDTLLVFVDRGADCDLVVWSFSLANRAQKSVMHLKYPQCSADSVLHLIDAKAVPDTRAIVLHWYAFTASDGEDAYLSIVDNNFKEVWCTCLRGEYSTPKNDKTTAASRMGNAKGQLRVKRSLIAFRSLASQEEAIWHVEDDRKILRIDSR